MQVAPRDSLDSSMQFYPISIGTKCEIVQQLWDLDVHPGNFYDSGLDLDVFFAYYTDQCSVALHDGGRHILVRTHRDVIDIVLHIKRPMSRDAIAQILRSKLSTPIPSNGSELVDASIDLAARVLLMMDFGSLQYGFTGRNKLVWKASDTLQEAVAGYFGVPRSLPGSVKLERIFNARNLKRIAGMKIEWTTNLADHLTLVDEEHKVKLFHHASFLDCQSESGMFPRKLIEETLQTIALLFPQTEKETRQWFKKLSSSQCLDKKALQCGRLRTEHRQIENFEFWHDRLVILKQYFDEAEPNTLSQWWCDRRKGVQWYTFWVAALVLALTIFFGLIQCVEGALQVYKAFSP